MSDFCKNVIPNYLESGESVHAYEFNGYWKDVGTIESLWKPIWSILSPENSWIAAIVSGKFTLET